MRGQAGWPGMCRGGMHEQGLDRHPQPTSAAGSVVAPGHTPRG